MLKLYCMNDVAFAATGWKPESSPSSLKFAHGAANVDCVTVWFFDRLPARGQHVSGEDGTGAGNAQGERDRVAVLRGHLGRRERERVVHADVDVDDLGARDAERDGASEDGGEAHCEVVQVFGWGEVRK